VKALALVGALVALALTALVLAVLDEDDRTAETDWSPNRRRNVYEEWRAKNGPLITMVDTSMVSTDPRDDLRNWGVAP
jgi:hypothetical protein